MRCDVVEGEPGIFPEPVTRLMRSIGGLFGGGRRRERAERQQSSGHAAPGAEPSATEPPVTEAQPPEDDTR